MNIDYSRRLSRNSLKIDRVDLAETKTETDAGCILQLTSSNHRWLLLRHSLSKKFSNENKFDNMIAPYQQQKGDGRYYGENNNNGDWRRRRSRVRTTPTPCASG